MPYPLIVIFIFAIFVLIVNAQLESKLFTKRINPWLIKHSPLLNSYQSVAALIGFPIVIVGGYLTYTQIMERLDSPAVGLEFVYSKSVAVYTTNLSNVVVYDYLYWYVLFNIDRPPETRRNPLQIPSSKGDFIQIGSRAGPFSMMRIASDRGDVKTGDRVIGFAAVTCPKCRKNFYWLYIKHGEGGWYAEMKDEELRNFAEIPILHPSSEIVVSAFFEAVEEKRRIPIE